MSRSKEERRRYLRYFERRLETNDERKYIENFFCFFFPHRRRLQMKYIYRNRQSEAAYTQISTHHFLFFFFSSSQFLIYLPNAECDVLKQLETVVGSQRFERYFMSSDRSLALKKFSVVLEH